ncbi:hypothetical protein [Streptantibioticus ferralitis]|uniref:ASCH domain-containing protein n=1 Tax=Streptantibioticus ferralitis TaxID=236510 RepID=A0ABT5Z6C4_9ACTN|nr:hypothetical protein [Streptantibioticus ferralitis]MDF2258600.1 hypothetical protein [Streptantibioticus ferralitis]
MTGTAARIHECNVCRWYFDLVAAGRQTIELRMRYPRLEDMATRHVIRLGAGAGTAHAQGAVKLMELSDSRVSHPQVSNGSVNRPWR